MCSNYDPTYSLLFFRHKVAFGFEVHIYGELLQKKQREAKQSEMRWTQNEREGQRMHSSDS